MVEKRDNTELQIHFLRTLFKNIKLPVLDAGCGNGRHADGLQKDGFKVTAVDYMKSNCELAKQRNKYIDIVRTDLAQLPFQNGQFGAVYSLYTSLGYEPDKDITILKELTRVLAIGGILCIDILNREMVSKKWQVVIEKVHRGIALGVKRFNPISGDVDFRSISLTGKGINHHRLIYRVYCMQFINSVVNQCGMTLVNTFGNYDGETYYKGSKRCILVYNKEAYGYKENINGDA